MVSLEKKKKSLKRKAPEDSDSEYDVVQDAASSFEASMPKSIKKKKIPQNVPAVPIDNISFHHVENAVRWKFFLQRRLAIERNLSQDMLDCKELVALLNEAGLMKTVQGMGNCYEMLTKEFLVNISMDCDNPMSPEFQKYMFVENVSTSLLF